jgi:hypothetical protein
MKFGKTMRGNIWIKDHNFYGTLNENLWNCRPHLSPKGYSQYHKYNDAQFGKVKNLFETKAAADFQEQKKKNDNLQVKRTDTIQRHKERKLERLFVQGSAKQPVLEHDLELADEEVLGEPSLAHKKRMARTTLTNFVAHTQNSWNDMDGVSRKNIKMLLLPTVVKNEESAVRNIMTSFERQRLEENAKREQLMSSRLEMRQKLQDQHQKTQELLSRTGMGKTRDERFRNSLQSYGDFLSPLKSSEASSPRFATTNSSTMMRNSAHGEYNESVGFRNYTRSSMNGTRTSHFDYSAVSNLDSLPAHANKVNSRLKIHNINLLFYFIRLPLRRM